MVRRGRGEGSIYQRADGKWVAVLNLGWRDGKRVRKVVYAPTRAGAKTKLAKITAEHERSALVVASPTVEQWLRYWFAEIAPERVRPSTLRGYNTYLEHYLIPSLGKHRLDRLEPGHVRQLYTRMRKEGRAEASIRQTHAILSRAIKVAMREGKVSRNVCDLIDPPGTEKNTPTPLGVAQAWAVLEAAKDGPMPSRWYAALMLGIRQGEALALRWQDVDLEEGVIFVRSALQRVPGKGLVHVEPKSETSKRVIPLPPVVRAHLTVAWAAHVNAGGDLGGYVWNRDGKPLDAKRDWEAWRDLLKAAGVPHVRLHAARNTTASLLLDAGVDPKIVQEILGHSTVQITQNVYQRGTTDMHRRAMAALEAHVGAIGAVEG